MRAYRSGRLRVGAALDQVEPASNRRTAHLGTKADERGGEAEPGIEATGTPRLPAKSYCKTLTIFSEKIINLTQFGFVSETFTLSVPCRCESGIGIRNTLQ
jgi:hypothetical protein